MDVKNIFKISSLGFLNQNKKVTPDKLKTENTTDRDANGQLPFYQNKKKLTPEEFQYVIEKLKQLPPIIEHKWEVKIISSPPDSACVHIIDHLGNLLKEITEYELIEFLAAPSPLKGQILKKTA